MNKSCGGCQHWQKWKNDQMGGGVCNLHDSRTSSDDTCDVWKAVPYKRHKVKSNEDYRFEME